jgi:hypothetical protein
MADQDAQPVSGVDKVIETNAAGTDGAVWNGMACLAGVGPSIKIHES